MRSELFGAFLFFIDIFFGFSLPTLFNTLSPVPPQIPLGRLRHWLSDALNTRLDLIHISFYYLYLSIILAHRSLPAQITMRSKVAAQNMNYIWIHRFFSCADRVSFYATNIRCANILTRTKVLFAPHRFLSNKSPIHFAGARGNISMANGTFKIKKDIDRHGPRLMPNNCKNINPPFFSLPTTSINASSATPQILLCRTMLRSDTGQF